MSDFNTDGIVWAVFFIALIYVMVKPEVQEDDC